MPDEPIDTTPAAPPESPPTTPVDEGTQVLDRSTRPTGAATSPAGPKTVPGFEILGELGRGGMGVVYLARQQGLSRLVALKMILAGGHAGREELERFNAEAEAISRIRHPNIVQVHAVGQTDGLPYFVLEYCGGGTLAQRFATGPFNAEAAAELGAALARAVHAAHEAGIVHRDLKPANVLLHADGQAKITDFGLSKDLSGPSERTRTGAILGTPSYMAPEQAAGQTKDVGPHTDVYALGAILYESLTGRPPFVGGSVLETLERVKKHEPERPRRLRRGLPRDLEAVVLQCLEKLPTRRYGSAEQLADDLDRWRRGEPVYARRQGMSYRFAKKVRKHRHLALACGLLIVLLGLTWLALCDAGYPLPGAEGVRRWADRNNLSIFRPVPSEDRIRSTAAELRRTLVAHLQTVPQHEGFIGSGSVNGGFIPPDGWGQAQLAASLFTVPETDPAELQTVARVQSDDMFRPNGVTDPFIPGFGWPNFHDNQPSNEASAWAIVALARALNRPGTVEQDKRDRFLDRLKEVQSVLDVSRSVDPRTGIATGGWNLFARQVETGEGNLYISAVTCLGLLDLRRGGLPWLGSTERRDELLRSTARWLIDNFEDRGWATPGRQALEINDGLTLEILAILLRAEESGVTDLPPAILAHIPRHLADCGSRNLKHSIDTALFSTPYRNHKGELIQRPQRPVRMLWHPWAIDSAARWLRRLKRIGAPADEIARTRRVLNHLVVELGPAAIAEAKTGYTYVVAETLFGLSTLAE